MEDRVAFKYSSQDEVMIDIKIGRLKEELKKRDYSMKDIAIVIHNHRRKNFFTRADYRQYEMFKKHGFNGRFLLYCHRTNKTYDIEKESSKK